MKEKFFTAVKTGDIESLKSFLNEDVNLLFATDEKGETALAIAAYEGHEKVVGFLLDRGADVNVPDKKMCDTPLHQALYSKNDKNVRIVQMLIEKKANPNLLNDEDDTALHYAIYNDCPESLKLLLNAKAKIIANGDGQSAMELAVSSLKTKIIEVLFSHGCKMDGYIKSLGKILRKLPPSERDRHVSQMLYLACVNNHIEIVEALFSAGAKLTCVDQDKRSLLHVATIQDNHKLTDWLVKHGLLIDYTDNQGKSPLHYAALNGNVDLITLLIKSGANVNLPDMMNWQPIHYAILHNHDAAIKELNSCGSKVNAEQFKIRHKLSYVFSKSFSDDLRNITQETYFGGNLANNTLPLVISGLAELKFQCNSTERRIIDNVLNLLIAYLKNPKQEVSKIQADKAPLLIETGFIEHSVPAYLEFTQDKWELTLYERGIFWNRLHNIFVGTGFSATKCMVSNEMLPVVLQSLYDAYFSDHATAEKILFEKIPTIVGNKFLPEKAIKQKPYKAETCFYSNLMSLILHQFIKIGIREGTLLYKKLDILIHELVLKEYVDFATQNSQLEPNAKEIIAKAEKEIAIKKVKYNEKEAKLGTQTNNKNPPAGSSDKCIIS